MRPVLACALVIALVGTACARDTYSTSYPDLVTARQQDALDRGWIPSGLPEEATDLREAHDPSADTAVMRATLPGGIVPDDCTETTADIGGPALDPDWVPDDVATRGMPVACGVWSGTIDGRTIVLWTDRASEADAD